jgi:CDGSH-type Zn-finger protein
VAESTPTPDMKIVVTKDGPYRVTGGVPLGEQIVVTDEDGEAWEWGEGRGYETGATYKLCRCGRSGTKPFCDGTHRLVRFDGTETADRGPYVERAKVFDGPEMSLTDVVPLCALAGFCNPHGGAWGLVQRTDHPRPRELLEHEAGHCPSGRLVSWQGAPSREGRPLEPDLPPSIGLVQDRRRGVSGPLWVRGRIRIESADGTGYEVRNRVTLCRCGQSGNRPFCDGSHIRTRFHDDR